MAIVDIIVPLYNKQATVKRAVESVLQQTLEDWRLIIINDGSNDNSLEIVKQFNDARIQIITQANQGPGAARNRGLQMAEAEYLAFLDADDQWHPWYLQNAIEGLHRTHAELAGSMYEEWPDKKDMAAYWAKLKVVPGVYDFKGDEHPRDVLSFLFFFHVGNTVVKTVAAKECGGFYDRDNCRLGEDTVFFAKLIFWHPFAVLERVYVRHNRQDSGLSNLPQRPLDIFLQRPEIIIDFCPEAKKVFARRVLAWHAWRTAHFYVRSGRKADAVFLLEKFPDMRQFRLNYVRLCLEIRCARWLPYWVMLKCKAGSFVRRLFGEKR